MKRDHYLLLTPGPLTTSEQVRKAMLKDWCTWDEDYNKGVVQVIRQELLELSVSAQTEKYTSILIQGSGTFAVEATLGSVIKPTDNLLIASNGTYGDRMAEIAKLHQTNYEIISFDETEPLCPAVIAQKLIDSPNITHVAFVHCETTTGIINPIAEICNIAKSGGKTLIVDAMSSFGGIPIDVESLGIDFLISSANKCIQGVPGFGYVIARRSSLDQCKGVSRSLSLDLYDQWEAMEKGEGKWRFTSPTHVVRAFAQALEELKEEGGIVARNRRYAQNQRVLVDGMRQLGFTTLLPDELQSPIITSFLYPDTGFNFNTFYKLLKDKGFVVYPGKISNADTFRIGNIGDIFPSDIKAFIQAVGDIYI